MTSKSAQPIASAPRPPLVAAWTAPVLDAGKVHRELDRLWQEWNQARAGDEDAALYAYEGALMRASTLNLIAIAETPSWADRIEATVRELTEFSPSRTVILVRNGRKSAGLSIRVAVYERAQGRGRPAIQLECVTVAAREGSDDILASVVTPLLVPELPDFLYVPKGALAGNALLADLVSIADRLIVDTASGDDPGGVLRFLAALTQEEKPEPRVTDVVWTRLTPWRQLIAQFFDQEATQPCLDALDDVEIVYGERDGDGRSGLTAGLLMAGWLATRLGWRAPGELVQARDGWRLTLRAGPRGRSREVLLRLRSTDAAQARGNLSAVTLNAGLECPGTFCVERTPNHGIMTMSETPSMPRVSRLVYGRNYDDAALLSQELRNFGGDRIYEEALVFAADLWPEGVMI
jgi:glucose-6-phosphate dehydrogenase assembly protein OpcA